MVLGVWHGSIGVAWLQWWNMALRVWHGFMGAPWLSDSKLNCLWPVPGSILPGIPHAAQEQESYHLSRLNLSLDDGQNENYIIKLYTSRKKYITFLDFVDMHYHFCTHCIFVCSICRVSRDSFSGLANFATINPV